ncbi:MAG: lytic transglycosylase domain-containing protein [Fusobacteria bacterium]|nr:lytic transglycosylase domain-containing protein [Fusobacteriota bacterium]
MKKSKQILIILIIPLLVASLYFIQVVFFPVKYKKEVFLCSQKYNIKPEIIYAIIKSESGFREKVVSPKGAVGLMQLLPTTASWVVFKEWKQSEDSYDLYNYADNINIGCLYFSYLNEYYEGDFVKSVAAYNAGIRRVNNNEWEKIIETKNYVKKVKKYRRIYKYILYIHKLKDDKIEIN